MKAFLFILCFSLFLLPLSAQYTVEREVFIPPEYYVGDETQLDLVLKLDTPRVLTLPETLPQQEWLDIRRVQIEQRDDLVYLHIRFRSFYPGTRAMPELDLGEMKLRGISLFTSSISEQTGTKTIRGLRDPFQLPGAVLLLFLLILLVLFVPPALFFLLRFFIRRMRTIIERFKRNAPFRRFSRLLVQLDLEEFKGDSQLFYTRLSGGIRNYLSDRTRMDYNSSTTREMSGKKLPGIQKGEWQAIIDILKKADLVKYAGDISTAAEMAKHLKQMDEFSRNWEEDEHHAHL